jgi:hypothetical protein
MGKEKESSSQSKKNYVIITKRKAMCKEAKQ